MKKVIYFGTYNAGYPRNRLFRKFFDASGVSVEGINERSGGLLKYFRLALRLSKSSGYDAVLVGFPGNLSVIVARLVTRKPIVFDAFISLYDTYVHDRMTV